MATYYEMLELAPSASHNEIDEACERLYLRWKGLVTHHDPATATQANQAIQQIETIRTTLTNPSNRAIYDQALNGGVTGGLVDLTAVGTPIGGGQLVTPPPPRPAVITETPPAAAHQPGMWACPKDGCGADNPPQTKFCFKCGTQLVRQCPNCDKMALLVATQRCGECGFSLEAATERRDLRGKALELNQEIERLKRAKNALILQKSNSKGWIWLIIGAVCLGVIAISVMASSVLGGLVLLLGAGALGWAAMSANPSKKYDPQIQNVQDQIRATEEQVQRSLGAYNQLADER